MSASDTPSDSVLAASLRYLLRGLLAACGIGWIALLVRAYDGADSPGVGTFAVVACLALGCFALAAMRNERAWQWIPATLLVLLSGPLVLALLTFEAR